MTLKGRSATVRPSVPLFPCTLYVATRSIFIALNSRVQYPGFVMCPSSLGNERV